MRHHRLVGAVGETFNDHTSLTLHYERKPKLGRGQRRSRRNRAGAMAHRNITEATHRTIARAEKAGHDIVIVRTATEWRAISAVALTG